MIKQQWPLALCLAIAPAFAGSARADATPPADWSDYYWNDYYYDDIYDDYGWDYDWWDGWEYETPYGEWEYVDKWGDGYWSFDDDWW